MPHFPNDALDADQCHGDLLLQILRRTRRRRTSTRCATSSSTRRDLLALRWKQDGFLPPHTIKQQGTRHRRNLLGFKDGTANPDAARRGADGPPGLGAAGRGRAGLGGRRHLSGGAHHPHVRRALGPHAAAGAGEHLRPRQGERRAAGRDARARHARLRRRSAGQARFRSTPISASPIRAPRDRAEPHPAPAATTIRAA